MTSHYTWWSVTALHDFGGVLGRPSDTFFWALTMSWSRPLAHVWSGPKLTYHQRWDKNMSLPTMLSIQLIHFLDPDFKVNLDKNKFIWVYNIWEWVSEWLSFIQHNSFEIICIMEIILTSWFDTGMSLCRVHNKQTNIIELYAIY